MICRHRINFLINYQIYVNIISNKYLHISHRNHVRKPSSSRRISNSSFEDIHESNVSGIFHNQPKNNDAFENFYGVEGDEGVIIVEELGRAKKSIQSLKKASLHQSTSEFISSSFGAIRLDRENRPSYSPPLSTKHKERYEKEENTQEKDVIQSKDHSNLKNLNKINIPHLNINQNISNVVKTKYTYEPKSLSSESNLFSNNYVENVSENDKIKQNDSSSIISSFPDENISKDTVNSSNFQCEGNIVTSFVEQNQFVSHDSPKVSDNLIDKYYFTTTDSVKSSKFHSEDNFVTDSVKTNQLANCDSSKVSESFIDKYYFAENYAENSISQTEKYSDNFIEDQYFKENDINGSESSSKTVSSVNQRYENDPLENKSDNISQSKHNAVSKNNIFESHKNKNSTYNSEDIDFNQNMHLSRKGDNLVSFNSNVKYVKTKLQKQVLERKFDKNKSVNKMSTVNTDLENVNKVLTQAEDVKKEVNSEQTLNFSEGRDFQDKKSSSPDKIETALDFVKKLRRNQFLSDEVKKGRI